MSKRLILMRHAKSSWAEPGPDKDRPLNGRGRASADALGNWLRARDLIPDQILCSSSQRTMETADHIALETPIEVMDALYLASAERILDCLRRHAVGNTVLLLGHNPGIGEAAQLLAQPAPGHPRFADYPTGASLVLQIADPWPKLGPNAGPALDFVVPRELLSDPEDHAQD